MPASRVAGLAAYVTEAREARKHRPRTLSKAKAAEKARLAKVREKEREQARREQEKAKEKARLQKHREREREKAQRFKERADEKARLQKQREREKAAKVREQEKAKEKARLQKHREREREKAQRSKERAAEKARLQKAREREREYRAREKARRVPPELKRGLELAGSAAELGRQLLATPDQVIHWRDHGEVPEQFRGPLHEYVEIAGKARAAISNPQEELERAIKIAGGIDAFKIRFGIKQTRTVENWRKKGISPKGLSLLLSYKQERQIEKQVNIAGEERLDLLLGFLTKEDEELFNVQNSSTRREGELTEGWRWTKRWRRTLTLSLIDDVVAWCASHKRVHPSWNLWHGAMLSIQFDPEGTQGPVGVNGLGRKTDYVILGVRQVEGTIEAVDKSQEKVRDFLIPLKHGTYREKSALAVAEHMRRLFMNVLESGNYCHVISTTLYNYRVRSNDERRKRAAERTAKWRRGRPSQRTQG